MSGQPPFGSGRGGRGALLLEALKRHSRRPGATPEEGEKTPEESKEKPPRLSEPTTSAIGSHGDQPKQSPQLMLGRGRLLQLAMQKEASKVAPEKDASKVAPEKEASKATPEKEASKATPETSSTSSVPSMASAPGRGILGRGATILMRHQELAAAAKARGESALQDVTALSPPSSRSRSDPDPLAEKMASLALRKSKSTGNEGKPLDVAVNYVKLGVCPGMGVFEYHIHFDPQVDSKAMRFKLINQPEVKSVIGKTKTFDGAKLFLPTMLPEKEIQIPSVLPTDQSPVNLCIKFVGHGKAWDYIHLYNILFRKIMYKLKMTNIGRNFFDPRGGIVIPQHKLEVWPGYITAVQEYDGGIMLNCDVSFRVLRTATAWDILTELSYTHPGQLQDMAAKQLIGCVALTRYNNKTYRIDDIAWHETPLSTFQSHAGVEITYKDYYKKSYDIDIKDEGQPLLVHRPKKKDQPGGTKGEERLICLIPELSYMTGLTDTMRSDFKVMKDIATHTRVTPNQRQLAIRKFVENVHSCPETVQDLANWGLKLEGAVVRIKGKELPAETIYFKDSSIQTNRECDWGRDVSQNGVIVAVDLQTWLVVFSKRDSSRTQDFIQMMMKVCASFGIKTLPPLKVELRDDRTETYLRAIRDHVNPKVQIVVIIFPTPRDDRYNAIKKLCCVEMPVPSQVINSKTIGQFQKLRSVTQKIALQMNCKLGGELWALNIPFKNVMVCGFDSFHDVSSRKRSVLGFVASLNKSLTRWFSLAKFQQSGQEIGDHLKLSLISALRKYYDVNHMLPDRIFIFRDGVSDGQLNFVSDYEVEQFLSCFRHFQEEYTPRVSVVIVQKRINTRIFQTLNQRNSENYENPSPGTVVDHTVTKKNWYDFFLVSQHVRQGTVSPTHYIIIHDTNELAPFLMQRLTYKLTHLYYNWPGTVRVPAPCQYAHKLAYLVGQNIHNEPNSHLTDKLFFL